MHNNQAKQFDVNPSRVVRVLWHPFPGVRPGLLEADTPGVVINSLHVLSSKKLSSFHNSAIDFQVSREYMFTSQYIGLRIKLMNQSGYINYLTKPRLYRPCRASQERVDPYPRLTPGVIDILTLTCLFRQIPCRIPHLMMGFQHPGTPPLHRYPVRGLTVEYTRP